MVYDMTRKKLHLKLALLGRHKWVSLLFPVSYALASDMEKEAVCNGAGAKGSGWLVPDTLWGLRITEAANIHDWMYHHGKTDDDKRDADTVFYENMIAIVNKGSRIFRPMRTLRAKLYYVAVDKFGNQAFWNGKHEPINLKDCAKYVEKLDFEKKKKTK